MRTSSKKKLTNKASEILSSLDAKKKERSLAALNKASREYYEFLKRFYTKHGLDRTLKVQVMYSAYLLTNHMEDLKDNLKAYLKLLKDKISEFSKENAANPSGKED
jgi:hypothetical protein